MEERRICTGIYGLDEIVGGGFRTDTVNIVEGGTGSGKTTFAMQYSLHGLNRGDEAVFITFEMSEKQILRECRQMGWFEVEEHIQSGNLHILHEYGENIQFIPLDMLDTIKNLVRGSRDPRIVIDPLTHLTFSLIGSDSRKTMSLMFEQLREIGTTVVTLEEAVFEDGPYKDAPIPLYLADSVIHLQNLGYGEMYDRTLRIIKHRGSKHGEGLYPFSIEQGLGMVVEPTIKQLGKVRAKTDYDYLFEEAIQDIKAKDADDLLKNNLIRKLESLRTKWTRDSDPTSIIDQFMETEFGK